MSKCSYAFRNFFDQIERFFNSLFTNFNALQTISTNKALLVWRQVCLLDQNVWQQFHCRISAYRKKRHMQEPTRAYVYSDQSNGRADLMELPRHRPIRTSTPCVGKHRHGAQYGIQPYHTCLRTAPQHSKACAQHSYQS